MLKLDVQNRGPTSERHPKLGILNRSEAGGIGGVAVECVEISKNTYCEGSQLGPY